MKSLAIVQKTWRRIKALPLKQKIWAIVLVVAVVYFFPTSGGEKIPDDIGSRIQQTNMLQGKLCLMKIDAAACAYVVDNPKLKFSYEACYTHSGEADVVIDLTQAAVKQSARGEIKVVVPDPGIDVDTLNLRAGAFKLVKSFGGTCRTEAAKTRCDVKAENEVREDFKRTIESNFSLLDARRQAVSVLRAMYAALGADNVTVEFRHIIPDCK